MNAHGINVEDDEDGCIVVYDTSVPLLAVKSSMLEKAIDSLRIFWSDNDNFPKKWDLFISRCSPNKISFYFSTPFFPFIHKTGYGVLKYREFTFVVSGMKCKDIVEVGEKVSVRFCSSYPICTWNPSSALFFIYNDIVSCAYVKK